ncbi:hypothetical protein OG426_55600 (plasmid) [Streptomyces canus]|uniref:hypothetical protein n=1 Tax=Streptomyces canus TaxID=58343 RepID=UPI002F909333|nr:hypothetical protein OG426_55600 [Streptomyces canus]
MARGERAVVTAQASVQDQIDRLTETMFGLQLNNLGLSRSELREQSLEELEASLDRVNDAMAHPESFGVFHATLSAEAGLIIAKAGPEAHITLGIMPLLLQRKRLILERIKELRPQEQLASVRRDVQENVVDGELKDQVLNLIDDRLAAEKEVSAQLDEEGKALERAAELRAAQMRLDVELKERRSEIYKSLLERETVAGLIGPVLLFLLALSLVIAMFTHTQITGTVSNSFLLILGYFFGQTTNREAKRSKQDPPQ